MCLRRCLALHELEYLHLEDVTVGSDICLAVRELSVQHRLRGFSIQDRQQWFNRADLTALTAQSRTVGGVKVFETSLPPAALTFMRVNMGAPLSTLLSLPQLDTLEVSDSCK